MNGIIQLTLCIMPKLCIYLTPCNSIRVYERTVERLSGSASGRSFEYNVCGMNSSTNVNPVKSGKTSISESIYNEMEVNVIHFSSLSNWTHVGTIAVLQCFDFTQSTERHFAMFGAQGDLLQSHHLIRC